MKKRRTLILDVLFGGMKQNTNVMRTDSMKQETTKIELVVDYSAEGWINWLEFQLGQGLAGFVNKVKIDGKEYRVNRSSNNMWHLYKPRSK